VWLAAFDKYCEDIVSDKNVVWGGEAEIFALSSALNREIIVYQAEGSEHRVGSTAKGKKAAPLCISFHQHYITLGNHYNSVVDAPALDDNEGDA
jgi:OTU domain-containing protein 6